MGKKNFIRLNLTTFLKLFQGVRRLITEISGTTKEGAGLTFPGWHILRAAKCF